MKSTKWEYRWSRIEQWWRMTKPLLDVRIQIPFITVHTMLMVDSLYNYDTYYTRFEIKIWKWEFSFALYDMLKRRRIRLRSKPNGKH